MEFKLNSLKPPLSSRTKSSKKILGCISPRINLEKLSGSLSGVKRRPAGSPRAMEIYQKIQDFDSPRTPRSHKLNQLSSINQFLIRKPFKTPSPKSSPKSVYSSWDIIQALQAPKPRDIKAKRKCLISGLKSI
jgi:hypothetical protein